MATFNPSDDALRKLVAGSRAVPDISSDDIEAALADATMKNTLSDDQVARVLGKVHRLITAASENNIPGEQSVSTGGLQRRLMGIHQPSANQSSSSSLNHPPRNAE